MMKTVTQNDAAIQKQFLDFMQVDGRTIVSAEMCGLPYKEYMKLRQKGGCER